MHGAQARAEHIANLLYTQISAKLNNTFERTQYTHAELLPESRLACLLNPPLEVLRQTYLHIHCRGDFYVQCVGAGLRLISHHIE